jgi:hypothetical protein
MDPEETLKNILQSCEDVARLRGDPNQADLIEAAKQDASTACRALADWLDNNGHTPDSVKVAIEFLEANDYMVETYGEHAERLM